MSKGLRVFLFLLFFLAFLVSAPIVVFYTSGYRLDLTHGRIVHTSVLTLSSEPRNATIFIDNEEQSDRTPSVIETILPGEHTVRLEKSGYLPLETLFAFESKAAYIVGPMVLALDKAPNLQSAFQSSVVSYHATTNRFAYVTQESSWIEVWTVNAQNAKTTLLMRLPYVPAHAYRLIWSKDGSYLALVQEHGSLQDVAAARVTDGSAVELVGILQDVEDTWWDPAMDTTLYVRTGSEITRVDVQTLNIQTLPLPGILASSLGNQRIVLSEGDNKMAVSYLEGTTASIITYLPLGTYEFISAPQGLIGLRESQHGRLILLDPQNREQRILFNEEVTLWKWNPSQDVLLYSSGYDLKRYVRPSHETQTITRLSTVIESLDWYPTGSSVLYQSHGETVLVNLKEATILSQTSLAQELPGPFWIRDDGKMLCFLTQTQEGWEWWTRELQD